MPATYHVDNVLCETPRYAIAYTAAVGNGEQEEMAKDIVGKAAHREVCGRFVGKAIILEQKTVFEQGAAYRLTAFRFEEDNRVAWVAEATFAIEGHDQRPT